MEYRVNKNTRRVWSWLDLNDAKIKIDKSELKENIKLKDIKIDEKLENDFKKINFGLSDDVLNINRKYLDKYILLNDKNDLVIDNINIIKHPDSKTGAKRLKIKDLSNLLLDIHLEDGSSKIYILEFENIFNLVIRIKLKKDSKLDLVLVDREEIGKEKELKNNFKLESIGIIAEESSVSNIIKVDFGEYDKYLNYRSDLIGEYSEANINMAYVLTANELYDMSFHQKHFAKNTRGDILIEGILKDESSKIFKGSLDFKKGSKGSIGNENESITNYSKKTKSISLPILLAHEDEIEGNHAANHGEFDEEQIYYIKSRGFDEREAKNIIAEAKITPILDNVKNRELKNELKDNLKNKLKE